MVTKEFVVQVAEQWSPLGSQCCHARHGERLRLDTVRLYIHNLPMKAHFSNRLNPGTSSIRDLYHLDPQQSPSGWFAELIKVNSDMDVFIWHLDNLTGRHF